MAQPASSTTHKRDLSMADDNKLTIKKGSVWHIIWTSQDTIVSTVFIRDVTPATVEIVDQDDRSVATRYLWGAFQFIEEVPQVVH